MIPSQCDCFYGIFTLYFFFLSSLVRASPVIQQHCPYDQRDALLDFKHEFSNSLLSSWNNKTSDDCCSWEGVTCDAKSTKVVSLYLDSIPLKSSLKPNSGLFKLQHLRNLTLRNCSLHGNIPSSLGNLSRLTVLDLTDNNLLGQVPSFLWGLETASFSHNSFNSFENSSQVFDETRTIELDLSSNSFQGPVPYNICKLRSLRVLDLSNNHFEGSIPQCLKNSTTSIEEFILSSNNFSGVLPDIFSNATNLKSFDVSHNRLEGKLPKSLMNCKTIKLVNVQCNRIKDKFPYWLGSLPLLNVLLLRTNRLYGTLHHFHASKGFQRLRVFDISHNHFDGTLSYFNFSDWYEMGTITRTGDEDTYMENHLYAGGVYRNSMKMIHKRVDTEFERIRKDFKAIDFSGNKFYGNIPDSIGLLKELRLLNLSGNEFTGNIPQSLANLKNLEILDLSSNHLSGRIPQGLSSLSFLSTMDFSHNNLQGPIPRSTQFRSQNCSSFMDNPKLNGFEETCDEKIHVPNLAPEPLMEESSDTEEQVINWIAAAIAYGPGVFCGFVIGHIFLSYKHKWFYGNFLLKQSQNCH